MNRNKNHVTKDARRHVNALSGILLLTCAFSYLLYFVAALLSPIFEMAFFGVVRTVGGGTMALVWKNDEVLMQTVDAFLSMLINVITFFVPFYFFARQILGKTFDEIFPLYGGKKLRGFWSIFAVSQIIGSLFSLFSDAVGSVLAPALVPVFDMYVPETAEGVGMLVSALSLCVVTPLVEEFVFRGVIFGTLRRFGFGFAAICASLIFGLAHAGVSSFAYAAAFGLVFCYLYEKTGSVRMCVLLHMANNAVSFVFSDILPRAVDEMTAELVNGVYMLVIGVLAVVGLAQLFSDRNADEPEREYQDEPATPAKDAPLRAFFAPCSVLWVMWFVYNCISMALLYGAN